MPESARFPVRRRLRRAGVAVRARTRASRSPLFAANPVEPVRNDRYVFQCTSVGKTEEATNRMAIHLTPTELARESGLDRRAVITKCMELGVPIFDGRIDKTLFLASMREQSAQAAAHQQAASA